MFRDEGHPEISLSDWNTFRREFSPYSFEAVLDGRDGFLVNRIVPLARGRAVASPVFLRRVGYLPGMRRRPGWRKTKHGNLTRNLDFEYHLLVRELPGQKLWTIEHHAYTSSFTEIFVFQFGSTPVVTRTPQAATYIADFCFQNVPASFRWIKSIPSDYQTARTRALQRQFSEIDEQRLSKGASRRFPPGRRAAHRARLAAIEARKKVRG
jgi:hypothetical protein